MDGILNIDKPAGLTSAKTLYRVRKTTGVRKSGHAGTLDPLATGVLVLGLGRATKLVEAVMDQPKVYRATARLDVSSDSYDADRPLVPVPVRAKPTDADVRQAVRHFEGEIEQVPPAVSALKVGGRPAYKLERSGREVVLRPRRARVYWIHVHGYAWPELDFELACGRGTYVRALIRDLGAALEAGGCLTSLRRRQVGPFHERDALTPTQLEQVSLSEVLVPFEAARSRLAARPIPVPSRPTEP